MDKETKNFQVWNETRKQGFFSYVFMEALKSGLTFLIIGCLTIVLMKKIEPNMLLIILFTVNFVALSIVNIISWSVNEKKHKNYLEKKK